MKLSYIKIFFSILSVIIIYINTNLSKPTINSDNTFYSFFYHEEGTVCPFGILCGKIMIFLGLIQIYFLYSDKYEYIRTINIILLILGILASFMNIPLMFKLIPAFILQLCIISL